MLLFVLFIIHCPRKRSKSLPFLLLSERDMIRYLPILKPSFVDRRSRVKRGMTEEGVDCFWIILSWIVPIPLKRKTNR